MALYSSNNADLIVRDEIRANVGQPNQTAAANPSATDRGLIGLLKGIWQTLLDRLPTLTSGAIPVAANQPVAATVTVTTFSVTTASQILLAANANRIGVIIFNPFANTATAFINFGAAATAADGLMIPPGYERHLEIPFNGAIHVIGSSAHSIVVREWVR